MVIAGVINNTFNIILFYELVKVSNNSSSSTESINESNISQLSLIASLRNSILSIFTVPSIISVISGSILRIIYEIINKAIREPIFAMKCSVIWKLSSGVPNHANHKQKP